MKEHVNALIIGLAVVIAGICLSSGIYHFANKDRMVTVKGLSTRDVMADHVVWPLNYSIEGNDLIELYKAVNNRSKEVKAFILSKGIAEEDISFGNITATNQWEDYYSHRPTYQYRLSTRLIISTDSVELVGKLKGCEAELLERGIIVTSSDWNIDYQYNGLPELKPSMIEEATKNARQVAQKFADDAKCHLGSIRTASQGQFSIDEDQYQPWIKHVRVVTTIAYTLN